MLEPPNIPLEQIAACLHEAYGIQAAEVAFLPLGADLDTAVYRAVAEDGAPYFVKLRRGAFDEVSVALPSWLSEQGSAQIIAALPTSSGQLWAQLAEFTLMLYPFVAGKNGYEVALSQQQWHDLGKALKRLHTAEVPAALRQRIPQEQFAPQARQQVTMFLSYVEDRTFDDPIASEVAALLQEKRAELHALVGRTQQLAQALQAQLPAFVTCHGDIHGWNVLIDANNKLYIIDWDTLLLAPKERDLMFIGGGLGFVGHTAAQEEALFYQGYGETQVDSVALAYYRYERIIQDIAIYCEQLLLSNAGGEDRPQALRALQSNFLPEGTLARAYAADIS